MKDKVLVVAPALAAPFTDATQLTPQGKDRAPTTLASGYASHGEPARLLRDARGAAKEVWLGGSRLQSKAAASRALRRLYRTP